MGNVKDGKYKVIENYNSVEGALYVNEVVKVMITILNLDI